MDKIKQLITVIAAMLVLIPAAASVSAGPAEGWEASVIRNCADNSLEVAFDVSATLSFGFILSNTSDGWTSGWVGSNATTGFAHYDAGHSFDKVVLTPSFGDGKLEYEADTDTCGVWVSVSPMGPPVNPEPTKTPEPIETPTAPVETPTTPVGTPSPTEAPTQEPTTPPSSGGSSADGPITTENPSRETVDGLPSTGSGPSGSTLGMYAVVIVAILAVGAIGASSFGSKD